MQTAIKAAAAILLAVLLSSCAGTVPSKVTNSAEVHKIGIIAALPETVEFSKSGITVFGNVHSSQPVPDWNINQVVLNDFGAILGSHYSLVTRIEMPARVMKLDQPPLGVMLGSAGSSREFAEMLGSNAPDVDLWIVLAPSCAFVQNYSGPVPCSVSVNRRESFIRKQPEWLELHAMLMLFDGKTKKYMATHQVFQPSGECGPYGNAVNAFEAQGCVPSINLGLEYSVEDWNEYSPQQIEAIHQKLISAITPALEFTLRDMNL